ncbi:hypothetical protein CBR_g36918 [Chara braunii]|uniref:Uncharacterized protein n=1 Tax=Chara braunii TaxID=69332 RepID=A0A388JZB3_CHABU|nr:hypothetical protein CBR_g36918 [Chara braunii]|eukprot:GBG63149.1 hypothetical protein CBR_g36918 [Chara braunii]
MRYATKGIHYYNDEELFLLRQRAPAYFDTRVDVQRSVAANGDRSMRAQQLLLRLHQHADVHDDHIMASWCANTLHEVVDWMCNDRDIDMTKREGGGSYDTAAFKKFVRSRARENQMLKTGGGDELKPDAAEILALSRMNEGPRRDPIDYHELAIMVVDGVEYVLLDQIVDFMKSGDEDRNLIHEALYEVTENAIAAVEVVDVECVKDRSLDLVSGDPVPRWNIFEVVEELIAALTAVDKRRKRKQGWEIVLAEHNTARTHTRDTTVQDRGDAVSLPDARTVLKNPVADAGTVHGGFREWRLPPRHRSGDFNEGGKQASWQGDDAVVGCDNKGDAQTGPQQENRTLWGLGVSGSDTSSDEEGKEYDPYWDVKRGGGQASKGWCHAILRLGRVFSKPHPLIRVVDKVATPYGRLPDSFAADVWEHHHQKFCKQPFMSSNKRKAAFQMVNHVRLAVTFDDDIERARKQRKRTIENRSSVMECSASGMNTLAARDTAKLHLRFFPRGNAGLNGNEGATGTANVILDALPCKEFFREALHTYMSKNGCNPPHADKLIRTRTHLAIAATVDETTRGALVQTARASPNFRGKAVHSDVAVRSQTGSIWYEDLASSLKQVQETQPLAGLSEKTAVRNKKGKFQRRPPEKSKTSPLIKPRADSAAVRRPPKAKTSEANKRQREPAPASPTSMKNRKRKDRSPPRAPNNRSCAERVEGQPRHNNANTKRRRIIEGVEEEKETIDLRGSDGVTATDTEKRDVSRDTARKTQRSYPYDETEDSRGRNVGTCDEGESYEEDASNEEEDSDNGSNNTEYTDDEDEEEEDPSRSSSREERSSKDNTQNTSRKTQGGTSDGRREDSNVDKQ